MSYQDIKSRVESNIRGGILVTIYNRRRAKKFYRQKEYGRKKAAERRARLKEEKAKEAMENEKHTEGTE